MIREIIGQGTLDPYRIRAAEDAVFCGFRILGEPLRASPQCAQRSRGRCLAWCSWERRATMVPPTLTHTGPSHILLQGQPNAVFSWSPGKFGFRVL